MVNKIDLEAAGARNSDSCDHYYGTKMYTMHEGISILPEKVACCSHAVYQRHSETKTVESKFCAANSALPSRYNSTIAK